MSRNVLLISTYNADPSPWNGISYEFINTIHGIEAARICAPGPPAAGAAGGTGSLAPLGKACAGALNGLRTLLHRRAYPMQPARVEEDYALCFFMCQFPRDIPAVERIRHWRQRSHRAVAFVLESWSGELVRQSANLRLLDRFDHVFVLNASSIPALRRYTSAPISHLPTAADCLAACPYPTAPPRVVDVLSLGRRLPLVHQELLELAQETGLFYHFDLWRNLKAWHWNEIRAANADLVKRSRYFVVWDPSRFNASKEKIIRSDRVISSRYFEAAAGGAIILGSRPGCPEFDALFDWPDAVVELSPHGEDVRQRLTELDADAGRCAAARTHNIVNSLRRHDWAYRWQSVLETLGLERTPQHAARIAELERRADAFDPAAGPRERYSAVGA